MNIAEILEEDHHHIDGRLATFVAGLDEGEVRPADFRASATALRRHIHAEEVHLFPPLRAAGMIPPVLVMLRAACRPWWMAVSQCSTRKRPSEGWSCWAMSPAA